MPNCNCDKGKDNKPCCNQGCCVDKTIFDIHSDFCKLRQHGGAEIKKCGCVFKLFVKKTCKSPCSDEKPNKKCGDANECASKDNAGVSVCLETIPGTCYRLLLQGKDNYGSAAKVSVQDSRGSELLYGCKTHIGVNQPFKVETEFKATTKKTYISVNFDNKNNNSELDICAWTVDEICHKAKPETNNKCCDEKPDPCKKATKCCDEKPDPCAKKYKSCKEDKCETKNCSTFWKDCCSCDPGTDNCENKESKNKECGTNALKSCALDTNALKSCTKLTAKDLQAICQNNCNFRASTTVSIIWNGTALTEITVDGTALNLKKIGNHDGEFTLDDVVNHNGDKQLAALIARTLCIDRCLLTVTTQMIMVPTPNIGTFIEGLPLGTVVTVENNTVVEPEVFSTDVNAATQFCTAQIEPFFGVEVSGLFTPADPLVSPVAFSFVDIFTVEQLATRINDLLGQTQAFVCGNCLFSVIPATIIIGDTKMIKSRITESPAAKAADCFNTIFGCSFKSLVDLAQV
jgi:hypothetical protein